jgi:molecular chaperone DnaJ
LPVGGRTLDCYEVLGVPRSADDETIRKAYRALARRYHPDVSDDPDAERKFCQVSAAYEVLSTRRSRVLYDMLGLATAQGGDGPRDTFATSRGGQAYAERFSGPFRPRPRPERRRERRFEVAVDPASARRGTVRRLRLTTTAACDGCAGSGAAEPRAAHPCGACGGRGSVQESPVFDSGPALAIRPCGECGGKGRIVVVPCANCGGSGNAQVERELRVRIPRGARDGDRVRVDGVPDSSAAASVAGEAEDVIVVVRILAPPDLRVVRWASAGGLALALAFLALVLRMVI